MRMIHGLQFSAKSLGEKGVPPSRNSVIAQIEHIHTRAHTQQMEQPYRREGLSKSLTSS